MHRARVAAVGAALAAVAAGAACNDPSLRIEVVPAPGFPEVTRTVVRAYESAEIACDDVEHGEVSQAALDVGFVDEAVLEAGDVLAGVSREDAKLFVAEGFDAQGRRLYAGCEGRGAITGDEVVTIVTRPIATTTILGEQIDLPFGQRDIQVVAVDAHGAAIDGRPVRWSVYGPSGAFAATGGVATSTEPLCTARGFARIAPADPSTPGPTAALVRVSWAEAPPPPLSAFITESPPPGVLLTDGFTTRTDPGCVVRVEAGLDAVYCLTRPSTLDGPRGVVEIQVAGDALALRRLGDTTTGSSLVVAPDADGDGRDELYAIEAAGDRVRWRGLDGTADGGDLTVCAGAGCLLAIKRVIAVPACAADAAPGFAVVNVLVAPDRDRFVVASLTGEQSGTILPDPAGEATLLAGGCVAESTADGTVHQAVAARVDVGPIARNLVIAVCPSGTCRAEWVGFGAVGFSGGARPRLLSSEIDLTGNVIVESEVVIKPDGTLARIERGRTPTIAAAHAIDSGDLDADGEEDLAWSMSFTNEADAITNRIQIALAIAHRQLPLAGRLSGLSPAEDAGRRAELLVVDLDHDGHDDVLTYSDAEASLYRSGVTVPPTPPAGAETTCP